MKILFLTALLLLLFSSHAELTIFPGGPLECFKAYYRGLCVAISTDCDLSTVSTCWDDSTAAKYFHGMYNLYAAVAHGVPQESHNILKTSLVDHSAEWFGPIADAMSCEASLSYSRAVLEKISMPRKGHKGVIANAVHFASVRPEDTFTMLKQITNLAEQGDFEAVGLLDGNFVSQAKALKQEEDSHWRKNAKHARQLLIKGLCESLGLHCPRTESLNCMSEESSELDLLSLYEWFQSVATRPKEDAAKNGVEFLLGRGKEILNRIPRSEIECDRDSEETRLINEKIGLDTWSAEWFEAVIGSMNQAPEPVWHYKVAEYRLFENNDLEGVGVVMGLAWYQVGQWHQGRLGKGMSTEDL